MSRALIRVPAQDPSAAPSASSSSASRYSAGLRGTEAPDRNFALTFLFVTAWLGFPVLGVVFGNVFKPFNPWRGDRPHGRRRLPGESPDSGSPTFPIRSGWAVGRRRSAWVALVLARDGLWHQWRRRRRELAPRGQASATSAYSALHPGDDGGAWGRGVVRARRGLLGLLRDALAARLPRCQRGQLWAPAGRLSAAARWPAVPGSTAVLRVLDLDDQLRRRGGGSLQKRDRRYSSGCSTAGSNRPSPSAPPTRSSWVAIVGVTLVYLDPRARDVDRQGRAAVPQTGRRLCPHPDPRIRLRGCAAHYFSLFSSRSRRRAPLQPPRHGARATAPPRGESTSR